MKNVFAIATIGSISAFLALSSCSTQEEMPAKPAPAALPRCASPRCQG